MNIRKNWLKAAAVPTLLIAATIASLLIQTERKPKDLLAASVVPLFTQKVSSTDELEAVFSAHNYQWPPAGPVPPLAIRAMPTDLGELETDRRKAIFFKSLLPLVLAENQQIASLRQQVEHINSSLQNNQPIKRSEKKLMRQLFERYRIDGDLQDAEPRKRLLRRLDTVPISMALAQAAIESGWGTSRFSREANNLFGEWTWDATAGVLPDSRREGASHYVRRFPDLQSAVRSYIWNLNVGHAYTDFRRQRERLRADGQTPTGLELAKTLIRYSERGEIYTHEIRSMIRFNELHTLENVELAGR